MTLSPEAIVFGTAFAIPLVWMVLEVLVIRVMESDTPPRTSPVKKRAA